MPKTKNKQLIRRNKEKGITLVALAVTIIVLLILAGISINGIFGESGLIKNAQKAKEDAQIAEETEIVSQANIIAEGASKTGNVTKIDIENAIDKVVSNSNTTVMEDVDIIVVKFNESDRYYTIDNKGDVAGSIDIIDDEYAGNPTKGKPDAGKTEDNPLIINCIEDLVVFSRDYKTYESSYVILARTLDFKSMFSYNDYTSEEYGDLNGDGTPENIKTELTKQGDTCGGFTPIESFKGTFDGQGYKICNLYENRGEQNAGLFKNANGGSIKNLGLKNIALTGAGNIGGITATNGNIYNCFVEGHSKIKGSGNIGLITGYSNDKIIEECYSTGTLKVEISSGYFGGIIGFLYRDGGTIKKCYNIMEIQISNVNMAGIAGKTQGKVTIEECYHIGDVTGDLPAGILGCGTFIPIIKNCYSIGNINGGRQSAGIAGYSGGDCFNCYSIGKITSTYCGGIIRGMNYGSHIVHCFGRRGDFGTLPEGELTSNQILSNLSSYNNTSSGHGGNAQLGVECDVITDDEMKTQDFVDELNNLIVADDEGTITETPQTVWKMDTEGINNGYPILEWQE